MKDFNLNLNDEKDIYHLYGMDEEYNKLQADRAKQAKTTETLGAVGKTLDTVNKLGAAATIGGSQIQSNGVSGENGYNSIQRPYILMTIPNLSLPDNYGHYYGYPCNMTLKLGELSGFTVVSDCHLDGFRCTKSELDEIERLLKQGVVL